MKIGLLFGGNSYEHDVSIVSARIVAKMFSKNDQIYNLYIDYNQDVFLVKNLQKMKSKKSVNFVKKGFKKGGKKYQLDVLVSVMHGLNGEDGLAANLATFFQIPYVGSNSIASGILMDKYYTYSVLKANDIKVLDTHILDAKASYNFPLIIKPALLGSSIGIEVVNNYEELLQKQHDALFFDDKVIVQKYLSNFKELNQAAYLVGDDIVLSRVEVVNKRDDILSFTDKYLNAKMPKVKTYLDDDVLINEISKVTEKCYRLFNLSGVVRFDYMLADKLYLNEINTTPGSLAYYLFDKPKEVFIYELINQALFIFANQKKLRFDSPILEQKNYLKK